MAAHVHGASAGARLAWWSILLTGVAFTGFGALLLARPEILGTVGIEMARPAAAVELRGFYGGLELGIGAFFFLALGRPAWHAAALAVQVGSLGGAALGRLAGLVVGGGGEPLILALLVAEATAAVIGMVAFSRLRRGAAAGSGR